MRKTQKEISALVAGKTRLIKKLDVRPALLAGDTLAFLAFALIGLSSHERDPSFATLVRAGLPFLSAWLVIGTVSGVFRSDAAASSSVLRRALPTWVPAWGIGLLLRAFVFGRTVEPAFALVSLIANAILLVGWRSIFALVSKRQGTGAG